MYERFTDRARKVLQLANGEAQRFNHEYIGTEHILLGLIKEGSGVAANVLRNLDIDLRRVRLEAEKIVQSGPDMVTMGKLPPTRWAKKVIKFAIEEARNLNHNYVGTEHLLLGLIREKEGVAAQVLMNLGLELDVVREEIENLLGISVASDLSAELRTNAFEQRARRLGLWLHNHVDLCIFLGGFGATLVGGVLGEVTGYDGIVGGTFLGGLFLVVLTCRVVRNKRAGGEERITSGKEEKITMYERLTDGARKVMQLANQEAQRFNHEYIGTEHILLGLVKEGSGLGANVLKNLDIDLRKVRLEVEKIIQAGPDMVTMKKLPPTPRAKKVIEYSIEEARNLNHHYVGTEHILLGLLREQEGVAAQVLMNLGLRLENVREEVMRLLGHPVAERHTVAPAGHLKEPFDADQALFPEPVQETLRKLNKPLEELNLQKEAAVAEQDFEKAAYLRDQADKLKKCTAALLAETKKYVKSRFSERARVVLQLSNQDARVFGSDGITVEHLLLGLAMECLVGKLIESPAGVAAQVFEECGVDVRKIYGEALKHVVSTGPCLTPVVQMLLTERARKVLDLAAQEARRVKCQVGTGLFLLGLLQTEGPAAKILTGFGLELEDVRAKVMKRVKPAAAEPSPPVEPAHVVVPTDTRKKELTDQFDSLIGELLPAIHAQEFPKVSQLIDEIRMLLKEMLQ